MTDTKGQPSPPATSPRKETIKRGLVRFLRGLGWGLLAIGAQKYGIHIPTPDVGIDPAIVNGAINVGIALAGDKAIRGLWHGKGK